MHFDGEENNHTRRMMNTKIWPTVNVIKFLHVAKKENDGPSSRRKLLRLVACFDSNVMSTMQTDRVDNISVQTNFMDLSAMETDS